LWVPCRFNDISFIQAQLQGAVVQIHITHFTECLNEWHDSWICCISFQGDYSKGGSFNYVVNIVLVNWKGCVRDCENNVTTCTLNILSTDLYMGKMVCHLFHYCISEEFFLQKCVAYCCIWYDTICCILLYLVWYNMLRTVVFGMIQYVAYCCIWYDTICELVL
jgi:hypothetical protein